MVTQMEPTGPRTVRSVLHAVTLLKEIARSPQPTTLSDLARAVGLSKPAAFNLLKTLELEGLIRKDVDARYSLTWGIYELGTAVLRGVDVSRIARPHLDTLAEQTGEAVLLAILDEASVLYLDRGQSAETFAMVANVGRRSPLHTNASGKVLLAGRPPTFVAEVLATPLERKTPRTIVDRSVLEDELDRVRTRGYATCSEEQEVGLSSIAVPVRDHTGAVHAALTIAGPSSRVNDKSEARLLGLLQREAHSISAQLGAPAA